MSSSITVEVAYALPHKQTIISVNIDKNCSVYDAVLASGIMNEFPQINPETDPMGIFGKAIRNPHEQILKEGQRVEIYRPLIADPKEARARRAAKMKAKQDVESR